MNFKIGHNMGTYNLFLALSLLLGVCLAGYSLLVPPPSFTEAKRAHLKKQGELELQANIAKENLAKKAPVVNQVVYQGSVDTVSPSVMQSVTDMAFKKGLKVVSFRPQRAEEAEGMIVQPYLLFIEGGYTSCAGLVRQIENQSERMAVTQIQVTSTDTASSKVSMTLEITVFIAAPKKAETKPAPSKEKASGKV